MIELPPHTSDNLFYDMNTFKLLNKPGIRELIKKMNDEYLYWDKVKYKIKDEDAGNFWSVLKHERHLNYKSISFGNTKFNYYISDYIQKMLHHFDMNIGGYMAGKSVIPDADKSRYLVSSIMEEAISSSQIEGANTTRKRAKEMLRKEIKPRTKSEQMIVNNYHTIQHITRHKLDNLTPKRLCYIHQLVSKNTMDNPLEIGNFRGVDDVFIVDHSTSEAVHHPPEFQQVPKLIEDLCTFFNSDKGDFIHPLIKGIIIHFMIGWIHPFTDGNGRTARALFYWYLLKNGYWLTEYLSISKIIQNTKTQYEKAYLYTENDDNDLSYFITYNLKVMDKAFTALKSYIQKKQKDNLQVANFLRIAGINERQAQILKILYEEPEIVLSIKEIENRFVVSNYTARTDLKGLVALRFMEMIPVNKVKYNFVRSINFTPELKKHKVNH